MVVAHTAKAVIVKRRMNFVIDPLGRGGRQLRNCALLAKRERFWQGLNEFLIKGIKGVLGTLAAARNQSASRRKKSSWIKRSVKAKPIQWIFAKGGMRRKT